MLFEGIDVWVTYGFDLLGQPFLGASASSP